MQNFLLLCVRAYANMIGINQIFARYHVKKNKENTVALNPISPEDKVPLKEKLAYGIGGLMDGGGVSMMNCVMLAYMVFNGVSAGLASTIMMLAKIWDAITDPFMGFISDLSLIHI